MVIIMFKKVKLHAGGDSPGRAGGKKQKIQNEIQYKNRKVYTWNKQENTDWAGYSGILKAQERTLRSLR